MSRINWRLIGAIVMSAASAAVLAGLLVKTVLFFATGESF